MARPELRFVPLLGAVSVALVAVGYLVAGDTPSHHAAGPEIRDAYDSETKHQIAAFLIAVGAVPLLFFAGFFRAVLRRLHPSGRLSPNVALAGAAVVVLPSRRTPSREHRGWSASGAPLRRTTPVTQKRDRAVRSVALPAPTTSTRPAAASRRCVGGAPLAGR